MSYRSTPWTTTDADATGPNPRDGGRNDAPDERSTDLLFEVLSHEHRRAAIEYLVEQDKAVPLDDLLSAVAEASESPGGAHVSDRTGRIAAGFHHAHLGKLRGAEMVVYDPNRETIRPTDRAVHAAHLLDHL